VLNIAEVAQRYRVHPNTVRNMVKDGRLPAGGTGRQYRFSPRECDRVFLGIEPKKEEAA
jgi:excisionase family DNA binding protein